jgi:hypothetical protein
MSKAEACELMSVGVAEPKPGLMSPLDVDAERLLVPWFLNIAVFSLFLKFQNSLTQQFYKFQHTTTYHYFSTLDLRDWAVGGANPPKKFRSPAQKFVLANRSKADSCLH